MVKIRIKIVPRLLPESCSSLIYIIAYIHLYCKGLYSFTYKYFWHKICGSFFKNTPPVFARLSTPIPEKNQKKAEAEAPAG